MARDTLADLMALAPASTLLEVTLMKGQALLRLPRGTVIRAERVVGAGRPRVGLFSTLRDLQLADVRVERLETRLGAESAHLDITLRAEGKAPDGYEIPFQVHRSGDLGAAASVMAAMRRCHQKATAVCGDDHVTVAVGR